MNKSFLERLAPLTGVVGVVLVLAGAMLAQLFSYLPPAAEVVAHLEANASGVMWGSYLGLVAAFFLTWFAGSLGSMLRGHEGGEGRLSALAFAGGVGGALGVGLGYLVLSVAAGRAAAPGGISPESAVTLYDLGQSIQGGLLAIGLAVQMVATALVGLRHRAFPAWFAWITLVLGISLVSPVYYLGLYLAVVWLAGLSVWLYSRGRSA